MCIRDSLPAIPLYFLHFVYIDRYWYVPVPTNRRLGYFEQKTKTPPVGARRREHGRSRPRQSRERRATWGTSSNIMGLISSYGVYGSKPALNLTSWLLRRHGQHIYTYICNYVIFSGFYCSMETSRIIRVGTRNNIIHIATVSQEHVLVTTARKVTRPENYMDLVLASKLTLLCGWSK